MNDIVQETLNILSEECAEVIQAVSKCNRFGLSGFKPAQTNSSGKLITNRDHLETEIGDLLAMVDILISQDIVNSDALAVAKAAKIEKLKRWSNIFGESDATIV